MSPKSLWLFLSLAVAVAAVCFTLLVGMDQGEVPADATTELDDGEKDKLASAAAIAGIAAESKIIDASDAGTHGETVHGETVAKSTAPPGFEPTLIDAPDATPPEGYSYAAFHEVKRAPMTAEDYATEQPPTPPPEWMAFGEGALADQAAAAERDWTFGWVRLAEDADLDALRESLAAHGGEVLGQSGDLVRARLPGDLAPLRAIAAANSVAGIGAVPAEQKVTDTLAERALANINDRAPVWITLMEDDPDGRWRSALKDLGADVGRFDAAIRTYAATISLDALVPISQADYVLAVETIGRVEPTLELAAPSMGADAVRSYDAAAGTFLGVGGASVTVGVMDSGLSVDHPDISSNRRSICGANFTDFFDSREEDQDLWYDFDGHGTHVTGIVLGNGADDPNRVGMAPLVQDIRFAKALSSFGSASALGWNRAMDWLATPTACGDDLPRKALVINSSLGVAGDAWEGRTVVERKIDASIWTARQLFVTSAGNGGDAFASSMAGAKNALSVGATQNIGDIAGFSSQGPTRDGRLMPNVVGTGVSVSAAAGRGKRTGYAVLSGTSMSSPSVVGVAALVMDAIPELREEPAALRARLMASAIKPDAFMGDASAFPLHNTNGPGSIHNVFGLGKVSARTAILNRDEEDGWVGGSTAFDVDPDNHAYHDIVVPEGASRLEVVMTWDEPAADTISNPVLHDLDLWVDRHASCQTVGACGQYQSQSRLDNVEWVIIPNPAAGVYRLKVLPNRIYGTPPRAGLAWNVIRGKSMPTFEVAVDNDRIEIAPDESFDIEVTLSTDEYVAAGANLRVDCRTQAGSDTCDGMTYEPADSRVHREDRLERSLARDGATVVVGEIGPDEQQRVSLRFSGGPEGAFRLHFSASGWNAASASTSVAVVVGEPEGDAPPSVQRPSNDDFANAMELDPAGGETTFDLVAATPDPGEPAFPLGSGHPSRERSLWYLWTAPETGLARFSVAQAMAGDYADNVVVEVYRDGPITGLEAMGIAQLGGGATFFAEEGETYRVRLTIAPAGLSNEEGPLPMPELTLIWGPGSRPDNDDYVLAAALEGENGAMNGNNQGATTEPGEFMGNSNPLSPADPSGWAGSVWYRWTAPSTGDYRFSANRRATLVAAFVGDSMAEARMVSGVPQRAPRSIVFPATGGVEYRIGVATGSAYWSGAPFELSWGPGQRELPGNDDFASAEATFGDFVFASVSLDDLTVEHGEPDESGVRTAWWAWQAPVDGRHTWLVQQISGFINDEATLQMSVFEGDDLAAAVPVGVDTGAETMELQLAFDTRAGTEYRVAIGLPRDAAQVSLPPGLLLMQWGATPENDDFANAAALEGMSGLVTGSNEFATNEKGEKTGTLGDSSLWWTFVPEENGWMRFALDGPAGSKLVIYKEGMYGELELVTISRELGDLMATFRAEAGVKYVLRFGSYFYDADGLGGAQRGDFELGWGPSAPPAMLRYVDSVASGEIADDGSEIQLETLGNQAFNGSGTELYVGSDGGIVVFDRDPDTGELTLSETMAQFPVVDSQFIWDDAGSALILASCDGWMKFTPREGGGIEHAGDIDGAPCPTARVLVEGDFVHNVMHPWLIETYRFDEAHDTLSLVHNNLIPDVSSAVMTADGENVYAITQRDEDYALAVIERDTESGTLRISTIIPGGASDDGPSVEAMANVRALAVHDSHLFLTAGDGGADTLVFGLADRANPVFLGNQGALIPSPGSTDCANPVARSDADAVDVACANGYVYTVQVAADGSVLASDLVRADGSSDAFGNTIPDLTSVASTVASPDGRHLYMAGSASTFGFDPNIGFFFSSANRLVGFERVYEVEADPAGNGE